MSGTPRPPCSIWRRRSAAEVPRRRARAAGMAYGITALLRSFALHASRRQLFVPVEALDDSDGTPGHIFAGQSSPGLVNALGILRNRAREHVWQPSKRAAAIAGRSDAGIPAGRARAGLPRRRWSSPATTRSRRRWRSRSGGGNGRCGARRGAIRGLMRRLSATAARASSIIACAIRCSPMITLLAPWRRRCAVSSSECERAMIGRLRIDRARLLDDLSAFESIGNRDQQAARGRVVRGSGKLRIGRVADDRLDALPVQTFDDVLVALDDQKGHPGCDRASRRPRCRRGRSRPAPRDR